MRRGAVMGDRDSAVKATVEFKGRAEELQKHNIELLKLLEQKSGKSNIKYIRGISAHSHE